MELKQYGLIVWRRIWIPILLLIVVAGASLLTMQTPPPIYNTSMRFTVRVEAQPVTNDEYRYDGYYEWLASEYMADDLTAIVSSEAFAEDVNQRLTEANSGVQIPPGSIGGLSFGDKQHRVLQINLTWGDADQLFSIAEAVQVAMENDSAKYLNPPGGPAAIIEAIDRPRPPIAAPRSLTEQLQLPVRLILAVVAGVALTFLIDYFDDSVRHKTELEALGISVLAEVPKK